MKKTGMAISALTLTITAMAGPARAEGVLRRRIRGHVQQISISGSSDLSGAQWVYPVRRGSGYKGFTLSYWSNLMTHQGGGYKAGEITETDITLNYTFTPMDCLTFTWQHLLLAGKSEGHGQLYVKTTGK